MIRLILWIIIALCLYTILTAFDVQVFGVAGFVGVIATWILIKLNKYNDDDFKNISNLMG